VSYMREPGIVGLDQTPDTARKFAGALTACILRAPS
jgi:hypothetical protein